jgi:hypothetical protein
MSAFEFKHDFLIHEADGLILMIRVWHGENDRRSLGNIDAMPCEECIFSMLKYDLCSLNGQGGLLL